MNLRQLLRNSLFALVAPVRALHRIPEAVRVPYWRLVPVLAIGGIGWGIGHYRLVNDLWLFQTPWYGIVTAFLVYVLLSLVGWAITGAGFFALARFAGRPKSLAWCDAAACHLWMVWVVSLLFDAVHLIPGVSIRSLWVWEGGGVHFIWHAGWLFLFPMLFVQLLACWRVMTGRPLWPGGLLFALGAIAIMRLGLRPLPELLRTCAERLWGASAPELWVVAVWTGAGLGALTWLARRWLRGFWRIPRSVGLALLLCASGVAAQAVWADTCTSAVTGNWDADATWATCHEGTGTPYPQAGDTVTLVGGGATVTVNVDAQAVSVTLNNNGYTSALVVNATKTLTLSDTTATALNVSGANCSVTINGTITFSANGGGVTNARTLTVNSGGILKTRGGLSGAGTYTFNAGSAVHYISTAGDTVASKTYAALTINGSGTFSAAGAIVVSEDLTVTAGTLAMGAYDLTVGTGTTTGNIYGAGSLSQSASGTTTLKGAGVLGGTQATTCAGTNGTYTFYNLTVGDNANAKTTTACGAFTVYGDFTIAGGVASQTFNGGASSYTHTLAGTDGTPFNVNGTFTPNTNTIAYTGNNTGGNTTVTATTYNNLKINNSSETFSAGGTIIANGDLAVTDGTLAMGAYDLTVGTGTTTGNIYGAGAISQSASATTTLRGAGNLGGTFSGPGLCVFGSGPYTFYNLTVGDNANAKTTALCGDITVSNVLTIAGGTANQNLDGGSKTITLSGSGTPWVKTGTFTYNTSTIKYTGGGATTVLAMTGTGGTNGYYNLTFDGTGPFNAGGNLVANNDVTVTAGTLAMGANDLTVGSTGATNSGNIKVASGQSLTQSSANTTTIKSSASGANCIGSNGASCAGTAGTLTFGNLTIGDGSTAITTTFGGTTPTMTVAGVLTIAASANLDGGSGTMTLSGSGTPFVKTGTFTANTSTIKYSGTGDTTLTATTYYNLEDFPSTAVTHTFDAGTFTINGYFDFSGSRGILTAATYNPTINVAGNFTICGGSFCNTGFPITFTKGSGTTTFNGPAGTVTWANYSIAQQDIGAVVIGDGVAAKIVNLGSAVMATSVNITAAATLSLNGSNTVTLTGAGTPFLRSGTFTYSTGTVKYTGGAATTVLSMTGTGGTNGYYNLTFDGTGPFNAAGEIVANQSVTITSGTFDTTAANSYALTASYLSIGASGALTANGSTITLTASGTPFVKTGTFTYGTSTIKYTGTSATNVTSMTGTGGTNGYYHLTMAAASGTPTFTAAGAIVANGNLTVTAGTLAMGANNLTVGTGTTTGNIYGAGSISQSTPGLTILKGAGVLGGTQATTCAGTSGTYTFYTLTLGDGSNTKATTTCGNFTVSDVLTVSLNHTLDGGSKTITLSGSGTPFNMGGADRFTENASLVTYSGSGTVNLPVTGYASLRLENSGGTFVLPAGLPSSTLNITTMLWINTGTLDAQTNDVSVTVTGSGAFDISFDLAAVGTDFKPGANTVVTFGGTARWWVDVNDPPRDIGQVVIDSTTPAALFTNARATSVTVKTGKSFNLNGKTLTLTGSGTPLAFEGTATWTATNSTVAYTSGSGATVAVPPSAYNNLTINGTGTFSAGGNIIANGDVTVTAGTLAMGANNLTVGTGTTTGNIYGAGSISQSTPGLTILKGAGVLGGTQATTCSGTNGTYTFYNLTVGDNANAKTTTLCGNITVSSVLTIAGGTANQILDGGSKTIILSGSGTPFVVNGSFTESSSAIAYRPSNGAGIDATVTSETYNNLFIQGAANTELELGGDVIVNGDLTLNSITGLGTTTLSTSSNNYTLTVGGNLANGAAGVGTCGVLKTNASVISITGTLTLSCGTVTEGSGGSLTAGSLDITSAASNTWTNNATALKLNGASGTWTDNKGVDIGDVTIDGSMSTSSNVKATSVAISNTKSLNISDDTLTLTGSGTPLTLTGSGALTENTSSTVEFAATSGTTTVNNRTYGGGLKINGSGGTFDTGGSVTVTGTLTDSAGTFRVGTDHVVTAAGVTINGGTLSMPYSGGKLKISNSGTLSMTSGSFTTADVATPVELTTSDTVTPTVVGVNLTGGTLNVAELSVDYRNGSGFRIGSGVTITKFDKVTWGGYQVDSPSADAILDVTGQTANLLSHVFPNSFGSGENCNVRANTSGTITMWDWSGGFGGENNDCDNGGEVVWKGGSGGAPASGTSGYPAIY